MIKLPPLKTKTMAENIIGTPIIDFNIYESDDPKIIILADNSQWKILETKPAVIKIILPGSSKEIIHTWIKHRVNVLNSTNLQLSCLESCVDNQDLIDLPDGVYQFILEGSPTSYNKKRYYLKTDTIRLEIDEMYVRANIEYSVVDKNLRERLSNIEFMLKSSEAFTRRGDFVMADKCFREVQKLICK